MATPRFTTPAASPLPDPRAETDPARLRARLTQLPWANPNRVGNELLAILAALNRYPEELRHRAELSDLFRAPCARLLKVAPHRDPGRSSAPLRRLIAEMGYAYKHLVNEALAQPTWLKQRQRLLHALYHAVKYLSLESFLAQEGYACSEAQGLRETLRLYQLAEERHIQDEPVTDPDAPESSSNVAHLVKRLLLLQTLDPCHLQPGEARAAFDLFNRLADVVRFVTLAPGTPAAGRFLVDLQGLEPPRPWNGEAVNQERYRCLNLLPAISELKKSLHAMERGKGPTPQGLDRLRDLEPEWVTRRILKAWVQQRERRHPRNACLGWSLCAHGLAAVVHYLSLATGEAEEPGEVDEIDLGGGAPSRRADYPRLRGRKVNYSRGGLCLEFPVDVQPPPLVGQPVLMEEEGKDHLRCGIVRRLLRLENRHLEVGVQWLKGRVHPLQVRIFSEGDRNGLFRPTLWVERKDPRLDSLLLDKGLYRDGRTLEVAGGRPGVLIEVTARVETSIAFDRCGYRIVQR